MCTVFFTHNIMLNLIFEQSRVPLDSNCRFHLAEKYELCHLENSKFTCSIQVSSHKNVLKGISVTTLYYSP